MRNLVHVVVICFTMELEVLFVAVGLAFCMIDKGNGSDDEDSLVKELLSKYNRLIRPVRYMNQSVDVNFTLTLSLIIDLQEKEQVMKTNVWLQFNWFDPQLVWEPGSYGGIQSIRLPVEKVWIPDVVLINNVNGKYRESFTANIVIKYDGSMLWIPPAIYYSTCDIKVHLFPFDEQICDMKFQSWTYNADEVMLRFYLDPATNKATTYVVVDHAAYYPSGTWEVVSAPGFINVYKKTEKEPRIVDITFKLIIRRIKLFYLVNLLIPTVLVSFLSVLVFFLPTVAGEKIALSISILLTLNVFILLVSKILPPASDLPLIGQFLLFTFLMNLISIVVTVVTINLNFRSPKTHVMPSWLRCVFLEFLPNVLLMRRPKRRNPFGSMALNPKSKLKPAVGNRKHDSDKCSFRSPADNYLEAHEIVELCSTDSMNSRSNEPANIPGFSSTLPAFGSHPAVSRMSQGRDDPEEITLNTPDTRLVLNCIERIVRYHQQHDAIQEVEDDWKYVALVVDRLLLWIFFIATTVGSLRILLNADTIFETLEDAKRRNYF